MLNLLIRLIHLMPRLKTMLPWLWPLYFLWHLLLLGMSVFNKHFLLFLQSEFAKTVSKKCCNIRFLSKRKHASASKTTSSQRHVPQSRSLQQMSAPHFVTPSSAMTNVGLPVSGESILRHLVFHRITRLIITN